ncbi:ImmA/IrrE family metallo-endopeptidase [Ancylothrix sp. C2]|uniref:ImmA/IrrE family metallo-endopeptidase n=1 Tax=Ancylothrix sp. D3o TaxID=2953691 RepID=UPI0021BACE59|nr:ImmA/IrrE family metallo-endopeptidase [Ancylothrix sp. D3o]MCT7952893.1 ImmA/IrrE family metallo-endopeptidase [Ancylothrix sp. D3o]
MAINILENIDIKKLGELLQQARQQRGMTQEDAAKIIDASRTTMVAIEKGTRRIKPAELIKLARAYGQSLSDFVRQRPVVEPFNVQFRAMYLRNEEEEEQIKPCILRLQELCQNYLELEQIMKSPLPQNYPHQYTVTGMPIEATAEAIATQERQRLGLGDSPIGRLRDILEISVGLRIFYLKMPAKYSEIYSYNEELGGCLGINAVHPEERRRWSLAHGYLHFLAHRTKPVVDFDGQYKRMPESEQLAEAFSKYFLMPTSSLLKQFNERCQANQGGKFTPTDLFTLAHYYGVSVQAMTYRLEEMKLVPSETWNKLKDRGLKVRQVQQNLNLVELPQRSDMMPIHYQHLAIEALDQGLITEGQFAKFLNVDRLEARRIAEVLREHSSGITEEAIDFDLRLTDNNNEQVAHAN